jgi:hypothetical protein
MFNYEIGTPCPAPAHAGRENASPLRSKQNNIFDDAFDQFNDNTTRNIAQPLPLFLRMLAVANARLIDARSLLE